ncbi:Syringopeptin synthetase C, partial [Pseudomonas syringae pv. aptata]
MRWRTQLRGRGARRQSGR